MLGTVYMCLHIHAYVCTQLYMRVYTLNNSHRCVYICTLNKALNIKFQDQIHLLPSQSQNILRVFEGNVNIQRNFLLSVKRTFLVSGGLKAAARLSDSVFLPLPFCIPQHTSGIHKLPSLDIMTLNLRCEQVPGKRQ